MRFNRRRAVRVVAWAIALSLGVTAAWAQDPPPAAAAAQNEGAELAKKLSNPIADLVSVPFQFNWAQGVGPDDGTRFILNIQPVMPFSLNKDWNMITRVIVPFIGQPSLAAGGVPASGIGDVLTSFFFSPTGGKITWGIGPVISLPSTSEPTLGSGKWAAGPTAVVLKQTGPWTVGALWNQVWSFSGRQDRADVSQMFLQPFVAYTTKKAVTLSLNAEAVANWEATDHQWTIPINVSIAKLSSFGPFPASYQVGAGIYAAGPEGGPTWQLRSVIVILLPRRR